MTTGQYCAVAIDAIAIVRPMSTIQPARRPSRPTRASVCCSSGVGGRPSAMSVPIVRSVVRVRGRT